MCLTLLLFQALLLRMFRRVDSFEDRNGIFLWSQRQGSLLSTVTKVPSLSGAKDRHVCACMLGHFSHDLLFQTLWTAVCQGPLSTGSSRKKYWSELPWPPPGDLLDPGIEPGSLALQADTFRPIKKAHRHVYCPIKKIQAHWVHASLLAAHVHVILSCILLILYVTLIDFQMLN